jgi:hypothetical protein
VGALGLVAYLVDELGVPADQVRRLPFEPWDP